ncbi:APC family permease [Pseudonocardia sp. KRD291]|uniref:APC family permease n=1 Tax=Pseudonocardia sp. KRD291 TaxID=2792007 RepID=UPI001C4A0220|nr:APC family permease [Pseudonocardia sp. KRD291]MBW0103498.1 APC family permease [Pseudonocardia sp. KRD291]
MSKLAVAAKRLVVGRPQRSDRLNSTLLRKRIALPVFASDAMSSVAYAPEEIFLTLSVAGVTSYAFSPWIGLAVVIVMLTVVASYRQNVHAYPSGGGDYEVATVNLGKKAGLTVASALLVDYTLTVAVSISSAAANIGALIPFVGEHKMLFAVVAITLLTAVNLRGIRESGTTFAIPVYAFVFGIGAMLVWGFTRIVILGDEVQAASANLELVAEGDQFTGLALVLLVLRSFTQGAAALTGVEAISNGVPAFRKPKSRNAATTLLMLGTISITMFMGLIALAQAAGAKIAEDPARQFPDAPPGYQQQTMIAQLADAVFAGFRPGFFFVVVTTALILVLAANTAFNGFPVLGSILSQDRYLPRQLHTRGDRLAYSNGIVVLAFLAVLLVVGFQAEVTKLIPLYTVGVFVSFTLSQIGMVRHWSRALAEGPEPPERARIRRSQAINGFGAAMTGVVLITVLITKFTLGAWIAIVAMGGFFVLMLAIQKHYDRVSAELVADESDDVLPSRNHAVVLVSTLHKPTLRALAYARATRPDILEAVTVNVDDADTKKLVRDWDKREIPVPLKVVESPYREITKPVLDYVKRIRSDSPRNVVTVYIPEYVVGHWWEQVLHNQSALRLKSRLLFQPGVMVTSVPWQLRSSEGARGLSPLTAPGASRRGYPSSQAPLPGEGRGGGATTGGGLRPDAPSTPGKPATPRTTTTGTTPTGKRNR